MPLTLKPNDGLEARKMKRLLVRAGGMEKIKKKRVREARKAVRKYLRLEKGWTGKYMWIGGENVACGNLKYRWHI